ncbi:MAG: hypothetical protein LM583_10895 [Desulfurococcaceae archaeon]|nr:hypothetical protein [Desulfurococcaceae archaeon]
MSQNPFEKLYEKDYIRRAVENLLKLAEEKKDVKCGLERKTSATGEYSAELVVIRCVDYSAFPISEVTIPLVWVQELEAMCSSNTLTFVKKFLKTESLEDLAGAILSWISSENCKAKELWEIVKQLNLQQIVDFGQVQKLFIPDILSYPFV